MENENNVLLLQCSVMRIGRMNANTGGICRGCFLLERHPVLRHMCLARHLSFSTLYKVSVQSWQRKQVLRAADLLCADLAADELRGAADVLAADELRGAADVLAADLAADELRRELRGSDVVWRELRGSGELWRELRRVDLRLLRCSGGSLT